MFKDILKSIFGSPKEVERTKAKVSFEDSTSKYLTKNTKTSKIKGPKLPIKVSQKEKKPKFKQNSKENFEELLEMFEKIEKTDGLINTQLKLSKSTTDQIEKWKSAFNQYKLKSKLETEGIIYVVIGFDFGTSSSKIIVDFPFDANVETQAFPVPRELRADNHQHCWKSILYYCKDKDFFDIIPLTENMIQLSEIKTSLMNKNLNKIILEKDNILFKSENASAVYLGCLLKLVKGWIISDIIRKQFKNPDTFKIEWEVNIGFPAAKIDVKGMSKLYEEILKQASVLSESNEQIKISNFYNILTNYDQKINPINIRPEVAAQSVGFIQSANLDYGAYALVDIGATTLDICFFNYMNDDEIEKQAIFTANVDLLGAESVNWIEIVNKKFNKQFQSIDLQHSIQKSFHETLINSKRIERAGTLKEWEINSAIPIILCGGGKESKLHQKALNNVENIWNKKDGPITSNLRFIKTSMPENLNVQCDINEYHRLSVAWGLSIEQEVFAKIEMPKDIDDLPPDPTQPDYLLFLNNPDRFVGAEHT